MGHRRLKSCINVTVCILNIRFRNNHPAYLHLQKKTYGQPARDTDLMLSHRLRSWNNTKPILCQWLVFARVSGTL